MELLSIKSIDEAAKIKGDIKLCVIWTDNEN